MSMPQLNRPAGHQHELLEAPGIRRVKVVQTIRIHELLKKFLRATGFKKCEYTEGMSDIKIANMVGAEVSHSSVARIRTEMFGHLKEATIPGSEGRQGQARAIYRQKFNELIDRLQSQLGNLVLLEDLKYQDNESTHG